MDLMAKDAYYQGAWRKSWRVVGSDSGRKSGGIGEFQQGWDREPFLLVDKWRYQWVNGVISGVSITWVWPLPSNSGK